MSVVLEITVGKSRPQRAVLDEGCARRGSLVSSRRQPSRAWTDRALMSLPRDGFKYELLNGEITMSPAGFNHGRVCGKILRALGNHVEEQDLGVVCDGQTGFRLAVGFKRKTVLSPDVSFVTRERLAAARQSLDKFFEGGPDLAVEVLSLGDSLAKALNKMARFFRNGTRLGWIVDARVREVHVVLPDGTATVIKPAGTLTGGAVLPKFRLPVDRLLK